jgi:hypothetical protein
MRITIFSLILALSCISFQSFAGEGAASPEEGVTSVPGLDFGDFEVKGFKVVPVTDMTLSRSDADYAAPMLFEILRPGMGAFSVGRILSSCTCLAIRTLKKDFGQGERAFIELRNVRPTSEEGATYAFFVQLSSPEKLSVRCDVFVKSERR